MSTRIVPITDLRRKAKEVIDSVQQQQDAVYITQHGRPVVVLVDYLQYESLLDRSSSRPVQGEHRQKDSAMLREQPHAYSVERQTSADLDAALTLVRQLSPLEKAQLIEQIVPDLQRALQSTPPAPRKSLRGLWRGQEITEQDIAQARREMWGNFPREDVQ